MSVPVAPRAGERVVQQQLMGKKRSQPQSWPSLSEPQRPRLRGHGSRPSGGRAGGWGGTLVRLRDRFPELSGQG